MNDPRFHVLGLRHWDAHVMRDQRYLGRLVVVLKTADGSNRPHLRMLTAEEFEEFRQAADILERALAAAFGATMFNWSCLMNNAYQEPDPKPHVHWHFRPRYDRPVTFNGTVFEDPNFGHHYKREDDDRLLVDDAMRVSIADRIRYWIAHNRA